MSGKEIAAWVVFVIVIIATVNDAYEAAKTLIFAVGWAIYLIYKMGKRMEEIHASNFAMFERLNARIEYLQQKSSD